MKFIEHPSGVLRVDQITRIEIGNLSHGDKVSWRFVAFVNEESFVINQPDFSDYDKALDALNCFCHTSGLDIVNSEKESSSPK